MPLVPPEPKWLFSNRNYWYPQNQVTDYATARIRLAVPAEYNVVASGILEEGSPSAAPAATLDNSSRVVPRVAYSFTAPQPVRYLGIVISRMMRVDAATVALDIVPIKAPPPDMSGTSTLQQQINRINAAIAIPPVGARNTVQLAVDANRRQESRARDAIGTAAEMLRLYSGLTGDVPYDAITLAMVEDDLPGGHAPGYFAMMNNPPPVAPFNWRNDPASFQGFPEFFLAHELAHQWFGQAVGWKNYHEQWLSEGFAQYFAALYAKEKRGEGAFRDVLRQFRRWAIEDSDQGPVYLGYRLGHIKGESRVFRALVYNKGAAVLHMLRRLIGDEAFFSGIKRFYADNRFKKAGTDDLRKAMEAASGRDLNRFFERWIYDNGIPRLRYSTAVEGSELIVRFEQTGDIYDVPVTVAVTYTDGKTSEFVVIVNEATNVAELAAHRHGEVRRGQSRRRRGRDNREEVAVPVACRRESGYWLPATGDSNSLLMDLVTLTIDGRQLSVPKGTSVLKAAIEAGIQVPYYCYHPGLGIDASCRVCLVKIEKMPKLQTSCSTPVAEGMVVHTQDPEAVDGRKGVFEFLLINHPLDCPVCDKGGECPLQDFSYAFGNDESRMDFPRRTFDGEGVKADVDFGPTLMLNRNRCILCTRCSRFMTEVDGDAQIGTINRGNGSEIATFNEQGVHSILSGNLMDVCPVGAITTKAVSIPLAPVGQPARG